MADNIHSTEQQNSSKAAAGAGYGRDSHAAESSEMTDATLILVKIVTIMCVPWFTSSMVFWAAAQTGC